MQPEILLVDEVLAVGDLLFQKKCLGKMEDVARGGRTVLFVSHNMGAVRSLCTNGLVLEEGHVAACGPIGACIEAYFKQIGAFRPEGEETAVAGEAVPASGESPASGFGRVSVTGPGGRSILQSEPFVARTRLSLGPDVTGFSLFCIVEDIQGRMVFHLREESPALGLAAISPGNYAIAVTIPTLWLNTGLYSLYFKAILWGGYGDARQVSDKIPLDITGSHSRVDAVLHPEASWTISRSG